MIKLKDILHLVDGDHAIVITDFNQTFRLSSNLLEQYFDKEVQHIYQGYSDIKIKVKGYDD